MVPCNAMADFPQPGDHYPTDGQRPGDAAKLHASSGRGGTRAPEDHASAAEEARNHTAASEAVHGTVHFSAPFIKRPVATFLLSLAIILAGTVAYILLPVAELPQVEYPTISVRAGVPGADPETTASSITTPLERQFSRIAGITEMTSSSGQGNSNITMQFDLNRDINGAARDVQAAINAARSQLPANMPQNPSYRKINPSDTPVLILALTSDTLAVPQLYDAADSIISQKISQVNGVGQVNVGGSSRPAVRIEANPNLLASYGIGLEAVRAAMSTVNVNQPKGYFNDNSPGGTGVRETISTSDQLFGAAAYAPLIIATDRGPVNTSAARSAAPASVQSTGGQTAASAASTPGAIPAATPVTASATSGARPAFVTNPSQPRSILPGHGVVRVHDIADVVDSVEDVRNGGLVNGKPGILVFVFKQADANVIDVVDKIDAVLPSLRASISPAIHVQVVLDHTVTIRASIHEITKSLLISIGLVVLVVFFFLREWRSTFIPSVSVPLSLLGTLGIMYLCGFTVDNLSLMALTVSTGFVIDDAIVVIENITRHLESGLSPFKAAMVGSKEIGFTVLSMSTSLIAVFLPILLMSGIIGRIFREFAITLSASIFMSMLVSLSTTPMLSAKFLEPHNKRQHGRFYRAGDRFLKWMLEEYKRGLTWVLDHQSIIGATFVLTVCLTLYLGYLIPKGFFPQQDTGRLSANLIAQQDISFIAMRNKAFQLADVIDHDPGIENAMAFVGSGSAHMFIALKPYNERVKTGDTAEAIINRLRPKLSSIPGATLFLQSSQEIRVGGRGGGSQYQYSLTSPQLSLLDTWTPRLMAAMQRIPVVRDVNTDLQSRGLQEKLVIDRDTATRLGVTPASIDSTLSDAFGQAQVSTTYMPLNQYHVVLEVAPQFQTDPGSLAHIFVKSSSGAMVPLTAVTHFEQVRIPVSVNHQSQSPCATISFNLATGASLSDATAAIEKARAEIGMPSEILGGFQGTALAFQASLSSQPKLIFLAIFAVYIVLGILYESFIHPLTILSTIPSAGLGALLFLLLFKIELSVMAMIGIILLIGIVKKNAIMMVDFAIVAQSEGKTPREAIFQACVLRFRPIMMTTFAAMLGGLPLILDNNTGVELRKPLGVAIVGGLCVSQVLTLFSTPVVYLFFDRVQVWMRNLRKQAPAPLQTHPHPIAGD
jgi:multidrug efflux pump